MENRVKDFDGAQNTKKPRSMDLQTLYDQNPKLAILDEKQNQTGSLKRKHVKVDAESGLEKKKSKKEHLISNLPSGKKVKKSLDEMYKGGSSSASSDLNKVEPELSQTDNRSNGFDGISLSLGIDIHKIPKRKRDFVRRKKVDASNRLKQELMLGGKVHSSNVEADIAVGSKGKTGEHGEENGKADQNGILKDSYGLCVDKKAKRKKNLNGHKESISSKINSPLLLEKENVDSHVPSGDPSSNKKANRSRKTEKETIVEIHAVTKNAKPMSNKFSRTRDNSLQDDEDNLEENAARMLSSRFDPSCTGFMSNSKCPDSPVVVPLGRDGASGDTDIRVLRPRDQRKSKGHVRKRRHFYEVVAKDVDALWMVQKKIKVYWPLDQIWYFGKVIGYDPKKLLHHIKYDDREEEWIDLQNERFKLLLFPSELPFKAGRRRSRTGDRHHVKGESNAAVQDDDPNSSHMDSEPIISWLARSATKKKSSSSGTSKKPQTSNPSGKSHSSSATLTKGTVSECLDIESPKISAEKLLSSPALPDSSYGGEVGQTLLRERSRKTPVVYFRRRYKRKEHVKDDVSDDKRGRFTKEKLVCNRFVSPVDSQVFYPLSHPTEICDSSAEHLFRVELPHFGDDLVILSLDDPMLNTEIYRFKLNFLPFLLPYDSFGMKDLWVFHSLLMLQHGTLMNLWPKVHLEMLFVDNFVGLRFLLFEGSLLEAIPLVFFILNVFHDSNQQRIHADEQLPVTSVRLQFSFLGGVMKQLVFAFYNFCQLENSRWVFLDHMLQKYCFVAKHLPPSDCTYNNIKALESGSFHLSMHSVSLESSARLGLRRSTRLPISRVSSCVKHRDSWIRDGKWANLPPFTLSFSAAPTLFISLHLKLLMECSVPCAKFSDGSSVSLLENDGIEQADCCPGECNHNSSLHLCSTSLGDMSKDGLGFHPDIGKNDDDCLNKGEGNEMKSDQRDSVSQSSCPKVNCPSLEGKTRYRPLNGITVEIPLFDPQRRPSDGGHSSVLALKTVSRTSRHPSKVGGSLLGNLTHALSAGKPDLLCSGPKKPRTQVSYSLPLEGHDMTTKSRTHHMKGFSHKRIRRASEKREPDVSRKFQRNMDSTSCDVNLLVSTEDKGWREEGARVVLETVDENEWQLAVKFSESTRYAYKVNQFLQPGTTNRYTHAMIWKGPKDWSLEFPDRSQWTLFKEMHEECYDRNFCAASVKNIPIPGVRLIEENDDHEVELPFVRPSTRYFRQLQTDVEIAMDPSHVLYDMDSDDELWISKIRSSGLGNRGLNVSEELFEKLIDKFEKFAYVKQQDHFTSDELEELVVEFGALEAIKLTYEHWLEKRRKKKMPLIRHLQPPQWEIYHKQVKKWESAMSKSHGTVSSEKPQMFAFCLKPRGLELLNNRGTKHRSQKKLHFAGHGNLVPGYPEAFHPYGRRLYGEEKILYHHGSLDSPRLLHASTRLMSPRDMGSPGYFPLNDDGYERIHYPKLYRTKSRRIGTLLHSDDQQRPLSRRNGRQSEWPSPRYCQLDRSPRFSVEHLDPTDLDEFRLRDASSAAQHAVNMAKMKREHAQRLLYKADLAIHKAAVALMTVDAIKASCEASTIDASSDG